MATAQRIFVRPWRSGRPAGGYIQAEVLAAIVLLAVAIVPMVQALTPSHGLREHETRTLVMSAAAEGTLYRLSDLPFATLAANAGDPVDLAALLESAAEAAKENVTYGGRTYTPRVIITDASGGSGGLLEVFVTVDEVTLQTLNADG